MSGFSKAWLSYKMKALTNEGIWKSIIAVDQPSSEADGEDVGKKGDGSAKIIETAVCELSCAAQGMFGKKPTEEKVQRTESFSTKFWETADVTELTHALSADKEGGIRLVPVPEMDEVWKEGYRLVTGTSTAFVLAGEARGILYGAFELIRREAADEPVTGVRRLVIPDNPLRMLNHWDNMDGSIERGYSGNSFFFENNEVTVNERTREYARLCASVGINATVINNVNVKQAATELITSRYEKKLAEMAEIFSEYGVSLFLSLNFAAPMELGGLPVSDPLNEEVIAWWNRKMPEVFAAVPKLGGFLVKADSEGRPGPHTYGRTQAEGANMLARAVAPFGGKIIWRCFVYNCSQDWRDKKTDRARAGYDHFMPLDGQFDENVVLQIKNGPMDFQVREPVSPLLGGLVNTNQMLEVQAAQEYTGQQRHFCYLIPMWKEVLGFHTYCKEGADTVADVVSGRSFGNKLCGMAAVANTGNDENWTGHDFAALNWFGFGRLAFETSLSAEEIAREWIRMAVTKNPHAVDELTDMALTSWHTYESYTSPLGIGWMVNPNYHYGPNVEGYEFDRWGTYHRADRDAIGVCRTSEGTGYCLQYREPNRSMYENPQTCPEELLLFFHRIRYDYVLKSGKTLIQHIYDTHFDGAKKAEEYLERFKALREYIPEEIYECSLKRFEHQAEHSKEWRDRINTYFYRMSGVPDEQGRTIY